MKRLPVLGFLGISLANLTYGAISGLNAVPSLPENRSTNASQLTEDSDFWGSFWNEAGGVTWKEFLLRANLNYRGFYTDNSLIIPTTRKDDFMHYLSPQMDVTRAFESESHTTVVNIGYQPTFVMSTYGNGTDRSYQQVRGSVAHSWGERRISLEHQYQQSSEASTQVSYLAPQNSNLSRASFETPISGKISGSVGFEQNLTSSTPPETGLRQDLNSWIGSLAARYALLPKLTTGLGFSGGFSEQKSPTFQYSYLTEKLLSYWTYQLSGKVGMDLEFGGQMSQSQVAGIRDPHTTPVFSMRMLYEPRYGTQVSVGAGTAVGASQFFNANYLTQSNVDLSVRQRIFESFALIGRFGYIDGKYQSLQIGGAPLNRDFTGLSFSTELEWRLNARLRTSIFHQYLSRSSEYTRDSNSSNQIGLNCNFSL